jgi:hypothetical protein
MSFTTLGFMQHYYRERGKIRLLFYCFAAHTATGRREFVFIFLKIENFQKNKNNPPFSRRSVAHQITLSIIIEIIN